MGVDITTYLMYGIKLNQDEFEETFAKNNPKIESLYEHLQAEFDGASSAEFHIIDDAMGGEYTLIGKVIESLSDQEEKFHTISVDKLPDPDKLIQAINKKLNSNYERSEFKLLFFNHFW